VFCAEACAQAPVAPDAWHPRLPGSETSGTRGQLHFHFKDGETPATQWMRDVGQGVARVLAQKYKVGDGTVVQYGPPGPACKAEPSKPGCP